MMRRAGLAAMIGAGAVLLAATSDAYAINITHGGCHQVNSPKCALLATAAITCRPPGELHGDRMWRQGAPRRAALSADARAGWPTRSRRRCALQQRLLNSLDARAGQAAFANLGKRKTGGT
jgi:hypothetical protein